MQPVTIVLAADAAFCRQLAVTISGISRSAEGVPHRIFVFHDGYDESLKAQVARSAGDHVTLEWIDARSSALGSAILPDFLPPAALYRLRMEQLLPDDVDRVIFLDTDVVVRASLVELWESDLGGALLAAVRDAVYPWAATPGCLDWRGLELSPDLPYFNSGAMLVSLESWRIERIGEQALGLLAAHAFRYGDQCALNVVASGRWLHLAPRWNLQSGHTRENSLAWIAEGEEALEAARESPAVVHFTNFEGQTKPWQPRSTAADRELWYQELDYTAWAGWRPDDSPPSRTRRLASRVRRAGGVLLRGS
jgi:lipopolysaccharide biosynthesis glycosyltransferase